MEKSLWVLVLETLRIHSSFHLMSNKEIIKSHMKNQLFLLYMPSNIFFTVNFMFFSNITAYIGVFHPICKILI